MKKNQIVILAIIAAVLLGAWFFWFRHYQDKQNFEQIEASMNELSQRIEDEFGVSVSETTRYCSTGTRKFSEGPLYCHIAHSFMNDESISEDRVVEFLTTHDDIVTPTSLSFKFSLKNNGAVCDINNPSDNSVVSGELNFECSKEATQSHYEFIE